ncbi:MAG TPA: DUF1934 domain-containing protein [Candidatus Cottocaccamicrobium excrementipullorum]|nr:DUF1934 domain-containing protein [Candidatus Cottocaccamicrobium excrementipullorum]
MTKDVLITISGVQLTDGESGDVEMITTGAYYQKNGKHYILYDEVLEGYEGVIRNTIKIQPDSMDIIKTGVTNVHMTFERNKKRLTCYATPMGEMMVGLNTRNISIDESENSLKVRVEYSLDINYQHVSECNIVVDIQSRSQAQVNLRS